MGGSDDGNAHARLGTRVSLISLQARWKVSQTKLWLLCLGDHPWMPRKGKSADVARGKARGISSFPPIHGLLLTLWNILVERGGRNGMTG
jgi:hypothetical protein